MKTFAVILLTGLCLLLAGCTGNGLGSRGIVKAVYVEQSDSDFEVRVLALKAEPSADTGQATEQASCLSGSGETLYNALLNAEQSENSRLFYGQNELVFIGPGLLEKDVYDACRFLASNADGRPNMAVYGIDTAPSEFETLCAAGTDFLTGMEQLKERGLFQSYLYQFGTPGKSGIIPCVSGRGDTVTFSHLTLYQSGRPETIWKGASAQLAGLLAGQADALDLTLEQPAVSFQVRSPKLSFETEQTADGLRLIVRFNGNIQRLVTPAGAPLPGKDRRLEEEIDRRVQQLLEGLVQDTLNSGNDVFLLGSRLANLDEAGYRSMLEEGQVTSSIVELRCLLRMV